VKPRIQGYGLVVPPTRRSIKRHVCIRCGAPAAEAFRVCATDWMPVCKECDIAVNAMVARFLGAPEHLIEAYAKRKRRPLSGMAARIAAGGSAP
jgi:hypothetical protein